MNHFLSIGNEDPILGSTWETVPAQGGSLITKISPVMAWKNGLQSELPWRVQRLRLKKVHVSELGWGKSEGSEGKQ